MNLAKGFARLNGEREVSKDSIKQAENIFLESIKTLVADEGWQMMKVGADARLVSLHDQLEDYSNEGIYTSVNEMRDKIIFSNAEWDKLLNLNWIQSDDKEPQKARYIEIIPRDLFEDTD